MIPESKLIKSESIVRDMQLTEEVKMTKRSLIRWIALSLGLISPKESRQSILALLEALLYYHLKVKKEPNYEEIQEYLKSKGEEINEKTIRYHLTNLRKIGIIENRRGCYVFTNFTFGIESLSKTFEKTYNEKLRKAFSNISLAFDTLSKMYEEEKK